MGSTVNDNGLLSAPAEQVERHLAGWIERRGLPPKLEEAVRYGLLGGGKRVRPALAIRCCEAVGSAAEEALPAAAALEMIHTFSLVHDDLPAMDDDDYRRGRLTLHKQSGEAAAILAGDALLSLAFESVGELPEERAAAAQRELARATTDMIGGQVYDTLGGFPEHCDAEAQRLDVIHRDKTGALLRASARVGAICGGGQHDAEAMQAITRFGEALGLMFQIVDDVLDVTQSAENLGKATQKDEEAGKLTWPGVHGLDASKREVERLERVAREALRPLGSAADALRELAAHLSSRTQ
jgi:geranylgeranyl diphosphate synthase type II